MRIALCVFIILISRGLKAQDFKNIITNYLNQKSEELIFKRSDLKDLIIVDQHYSESMGLHNVYVQQAYQGIPILNAIGTFAIKQKRVVNFNSSFIANLENKIETKSTKLSAKKALHHVANNLGLNVKFELYEHSLPNKLIFESNNLKENVPLKLMYILDANDKLRTVWDLSILTPDQNHWWSISLDAVNGEILRQNDWMLNCGFEEIHNYNLKRIKTPKNTFKTLNFIAESSQYRAFPIGIESPNHGNRRLISNPFNSTASPYGWHDTDGVTGAEFTITRGNNVYASEDTNASNSTGYSPDGGENLIFDFIINKDLPPSFNQDAALTNLFVWNNFLHDVWLNYGFDESSGNFQETNYSGQGEGSDFVIADGQDGSGFNNANFATPPEGSKPRMQMFLWSPSPPPEDILSINFPLNISGGYFGLQANFGPRLTPTPITSDLVLIEDDNTSAESSDPHDACDTISNADVLNGKIVVINRGSCFFVQKIQAAQSNNAIAVIVINNVPGDPILMGGNGININIPSIMISQDLGLTIINKLQDGEAINATLANDGPFEIDGDFDNGIIAHEYGHGISNRLTGGADNANCLFNDEQMGEGWSDWIGLMMTMKPEDTPEKPRGYGTFAISQPTTGNGIRPARYSTDMSINPATYGTTNNPNISIPHGVGYVWATMLWDLTWELIDRYGFDSDLYHGSGGNNLAMQLVTDAMKLQSCNPGFVDARDAILQADLLANGGDNQCSIWKVFANRGLGFSAEQGSSLDRFDQVEAFDLPPSITLPCKVLSVDEVAKRSLKIYPNPATDFLKIKSPLGTIGNANLKIFDIQGRMIYNEPFDFNFLLQIDISKYQSGIYMLKIENTQVNISKKLIIK